MKRLRLRHVVFTIALLFIVAAFVYFRPIQLSEIEPSVLEDAVKIQVTQYNGAVDDEYEVTDEAKMGLVAQYMGDILVRRIIPPFAPREFIEKPDEHYSVVIHHLSGPVDIITLNRGYVTTTDQRTYSVWAPKSFSLLKKMMTALK
ncbi:MAG: hypothetical protein RR296_11540 [Clostridia bacterium]